MKTKYILIIAIIAACIASCRSVRTIAAEKPIYIHDTTQTVRELHDSIYIDRFREVTKKNDTIYITDSIAVIKYSLKTDTAYRYVEKPVTITRTETVEVERKHSKLHKIMIGSGVALWLIVFIVATGVILRKLERK